MPIGSKFDDFLKDEGIFETTTAAAIKKVLALQIEEEMQAQRLTKTAMQPGCAKPLAGRQRHQPDAHDTGKCSCGLGQARECGVGSGVTPLHVRGISGNGCDIERPDPDMLFELLRNGQLAGRWLDFGFFF